MISTCEPSSSPVTAWASAGGLLHLIPRSAVRWDIPFNEPLGYIQGQFGYLVAQQFLITTMLRVNVAIGWMLGHGTKTCVAQALGSRFGAI